MGSTILLLFGQGFLPPGHFAFTASGGISVFGEAETSFHEKPEPPITPDGLACIQHGERVYVKWKVINRNYVPAITVCIYDL